MTDITEKDRRDARQWASRIGKGTSVAFDDAKAAARYILAPTPQIIRTPAELSALDPDTLVEKPGTVTRTARQAINVAGHWGVGAVLPAVVVASGEHLRACREALEGETT